MAGQELDRPAERTPQELNTELRKFLDYIPDPSLLDIGEGGLTPETPELIRVLGYHLKLETIRRARRTSPELANLSAELLLLLSRSLITPSFQQKIVQMFRFAYEGGKPREQDELSTSSAVYESLLRFMDMDEPESAGIFDPARAEAIEREAYQNTVFGLAFVTGTIIDTGADPERQNPMFKLVPRVELVRRWRQEFARHYGTQP